ncbi:MAG: hypothetical protein CL528_00500 [Aequorivita sp.]|jgi:hypothetical protein|nr:hypothetical protein [Aequorivita sp.]MBP40230.1 hypothetical protein [Aequorivita sp.]|tara:strand:- start:185 stop:646 length:462 start_codon:yes stop_codon:yes gene_type:complete
MKKMITLFAFIALTFACSSDDDAPAPEIKFPSDYLVEGSPWNFTDIELLRINYNPNNLTIAEAQTLFKNTYTGFKLDFQENGTGSATLPDNSSYSFNWVLSTDYKTLTLTGNAPATFTNVLITENKFLWSDTDYCVADGQGDDVCADVRFTFE